MNYQMHPPRIQLFPAEEYDRRLQCVREGMVRSELDVLLVHRPENIFYLTGYQTPGYYWHQVLVLPLDSEPVFIAPPHEKRRWSLNTAGWTMCGFTRTHRTGLKLRQIYLKSCG